MPKEGGWRPGARWAKSDLAAEIEAMPAHQRPSQRQLGRVEVAAAHPFAGPEREMARRTEAAENPFGSRARGQWLAPDQLQAAIDALPAHQRPSFQELSRRSEVTGNVFPPRPSEPHPFKPMPPDEAGFVPAAAMPSLQFPGEDAPAKAGRGAALRESAARARYRNEGPSLRQLAQVPPVQFPGEDVAARRAQRQPKRSSRDGHNGEAGSIAPPSLKQLAMMPSVQFPGEGPHPDNHGRSEPTAPTYGAGRFFQTGRTLGSVVARVCADDEGDSAAPAFVPPAEPPLVTTHKVGSRVEVAAANPAARMLGVHPGMALTLARAMVAGLEMRAADPEGDRADLLRLADRLARRWTPTVAVSDADGLFLDLSGVAHLHGGEARLARRLVRLLARHGVRARVAVADTAGGAWALARFGSATAIRRDARVRGGPAPGGNGQGAPGWAALPAPEIDTGGGDAALVAPPGSQAALLAVLPVQGLRLDPRTLDLLARLGIDRIGQLMKMPRGPLVRRFGAALSTRLDQALGQAPEPLDPLVPQEPIVVEQRFAEPIATAEAIDYWLGVLVPRLCQALAEAGLGARAVELVAARVDGIDQRLRLGLARPTRAPAHLLRLARRRIEAIEPGFGIDAMALHVRRTDPLGAETLAPALAGEDAPDLSTLVDAIVNRIGTRRLWRESPMESDVPERALARRAPLDALEEDGLALREDDVRRLDERPRDHPWHPRWPRPARLLRRPERVDNVMYGLPDQPPRRFTWRGRTHRVVRADGPERIGGEWWRRPAERLAVRDYYRVEDEAGARFWLYRRGDGLRAETGDLSWYLHGQFG